MRSAINVTISSIHHKLKNEKKSMATIVHLWVCSSDCRNSATTSLTLQVRARLSTLHSLIVFSSTSRNLSLHKTMDSKTLGGINRSEWITWNSIALLPFKKFQHPKHNNTADKQERVRASLGPATLGCPSTTFTTEVLYINGRKTSSRVRS